MREPNLPSHNEQRRGDELPRPLAPNPWPGNPNAYPCPWGCNGTGSMPWFNHIQGGVCFACHGRGWQLGRGNRPAPVKRSTISTTSGRRWRRDGGRIVPA